jgi:4-hydroxy-4-methyl-2-oxoglutarate aldolase
MRQFNLEVTRTPSEQVAQFLALETATVYEQNQKQGALGSAIRCIFPGLKTCGTALTVQCQPADNLTLHAAIALAQPGDVLVADVGGYCEAGHWGEITTVAAQQRGVAGLVINGGVRDIAAIRLRGFPIFAAAVCMKATVKAVPGRINHPIHCGGVLVEAGDLVLGDDDGVVVVSQAQVANVLLAAQEKAAAEAEVMRRLEQGELTLDILGFRQVLAAQQLSI